MSPAERKYLDWLHELEMERVRPCPYFHAPDPFQPKVSGGDGLTWEQRVQRSRFAKFQRMQREVR